MAIGDVYQLGVNQILHGVSLANIYNFEQTSDVDPGEDPENSLIRAYIEHIIPLQAAFSTTTWAMSCVTARKVRPTGGVQFAVADTTVGTEADGAYPSNVAALASLYADPATPRGRSRHWYSGFPEDSASAGRLDIAALAEFTTFMNRLTTSISWVSDNADFIIRILSSVDAVVRSVDHAICRVRTRYLKGRRQSVC